MSWSIRNKFLAVALVFISSFSYSQQIKMRGIITDNEKNPLEIANIMGINQSTQNIDSYGFTDEFGNYKLNLNAHTSYLIRVSYVGMKTKEIEIVSADKPIKKDIVLELDTTLTAVEIVSKMSILVKEDTIVYNTESFTNGTEKKLEDVLRKLPGVEVNKEGEVLVQGKKVKKVMVENKPFFDGNTKLATKNIPASALEKVEVLKNHNDVSQLKNVTDNEDNVALNIKLKKGKKKFWFGDVTASADIARKDKRYLMNPNLFYYSPKTNINLIGNLNNIGKTPFTLSDYFKFSGGFANIGKGTTVSSNELKMLTQSNDVKEQKNTFGALNLNFSPNDKFNISGYGIYSKNTSESLAITEKSYISLNPSDDNALQKEILEAASNQNNQLGLSKFTFNYVPNTKHRIDYDFFAKYADLDKNFQKSSERIAQNDSSRIVPIEETNKVQSLKMQQHINYYFSSNPKHIFALKSKHLLEKSSPAYLLKTSQLPFSKRLGLPFSEMYQLNQSKEIATHSFNFNLDYYYVINQKSNLNFLVGSALNEQKFNSEILTGNQINNDILYHVNDYFVGSYYKLLVGKFLFNPGVVFHKYQTNNSQYNQKVSENFHQFIPDVSLKLSLKKSETLRLRYTKQIDFSEVESLAKGLVISNYNTLFYGNPNLRHSLRHSINLNYYSFNMFNFTNVSAYVNYSKSIKKINNVTELDGINLLQTTQNAALPVESLTLNGSFGKNFKSLKVNLKANLFYNKSYNMLRIANHSSDVINRKNTTFSQNYTFGLSSNLDAFFDFDLGYTIGLNTYSQQSLSNQFINHSPYLNLDFFIIDGLILSSKFTYNSYQSERNLLNEYSFWDAELSYQKKESKWEFFVKPKLRIRNFKRNFQGVIPDS